MPQFSKVIQWFRSWRGATTCIVALVLLKLALLPWSAHPFDFWTFVNTFQRQTLYGWNVFEYWNKGDLLIAGWYPMYALYLKAIVLFHHSAAYTPLLHLAFKLPFLFLDLLSGYLLFKAAHVLSGSLRTAWNTFWLWSINPLVFYVYGIHGHYELLTVFGIVLMIYSLVRPSALWLAASLVILFTTKYFVVIFFPFIVLYLIAARRVRMLWLTAGIAVLGLAASYAHLIVHPYLIPQTLGSIVSLSSSAAAGQVSHVTLPSLNLFSAINWLFYPDNPVNGLSNATLLPLASLNLKIVIVAFAFHFGYRLYRIVRKHEAYSLETVLIDLLIALVYLLAPLANFQAHYLSWFIPLILMISISRPAILAGAVPFVLAGFALAFKNELGPRTFFLDILPRYDGALIWDRVTLPTMYGLGAAVIASIAFIIILAAKKGIPVPRFWGQGLAGVSLICWLITVTAYWQVLSITGVSRVPDQLSFVSNSRIFPGAIYVSYPVTDYGSQTVTFSQSNVSGSLVYEDLSSMSDSEASAFHLYVIMKSADGAQPLRNAAATTTLNGCPAQPATTVTDLADHEKYAALPFNIRCLRHGASALSAPSSLVAPHYEMEVYVENEPAPWPYNPSFGTALKALSLVGLAYLAGMIASAFWIIRKLAREGQE